MSRTRIAALVAGLIVGAPTLVACSGGSDAGPEEPSDTVRTTSEEPAPSTGDAPDETPPATSSGPAPATGGLIELEGLSLRVPDDWTVGDEDGVGGTASYVEGPLANTLGVRIQDNLGISSSFAEIIELRNDLELLYQRDPKTRAPVTIDGVEMFHLSGPVSDYTWAEAFGTDLGAVTIDISFIFADRITSPAERRRIVDSVLASIEID